MKSNYVIGIDVGGTKVAYGLFDSEGKLVSRMQHPTDASTDGPAFADEIVRNVQALVRQNEGKWEDLEGVGIGMPSFILFDEGYICMTSAMTGIKEFAMRDYLAQRLPTRIVLDNDSNVAALAEHRHGAGRGSAHMIYMSVGTGVGSGIIINNALFRGSYGWAGEAGHMLITPNQGIVCGCQNQGCFMSYTAGRYVPEHVRSALAQGEVSGLTDCAELDCKAILAAYHRQDALAVKTVQSMAHTLAICAFNMYQMLNINLFVFGGGLVHFGDALFVPMRREFDRYNHIPYPVTFRFAELETDFGIIGAAELAKE